MTEYEIGVTQCKEPAAARRRGRSTHQARPPSAFDTRSLASEARLTPPAASVGFLPRTGLVNRLRVTRDAAVILLAAPPAYGKSSLLAEWARRDERTFCWYRVRPADDAVAVASSLAESLELACPSIVGGAGSVADETRLDRLLARLSTLLASTERDVVLVLDDVDLLRTPDSLSFLRQLVDLLPEGTQLVLAGRSTPPLPIARMRTERRLAEFRIPDLRMSDREARLVLRSRGVELPFAQVRELNTWLDGWPGGLRLAAHGLARAEPSDHVLGTARRQVLAYFQEQVLPQLRTAEREVLMAVAVLERISGPLADALTDTIGSAETLANLYKRSVFVEALDRSGMWYRLQSPFRRALFGQLQRERPGAVQELRRRAARWCEDHGLVEEALGYATAARDKERLLSLARHSDLPFGVGVGTAFVEEWLGILGEDGVLESAPDVATIGALTWATHGHPGPAQRLGERVTLSESGRGRRRLAAKGDAWAHLLRAMTSPASPAEMRRHATIAAATLAEGDPHRPLALISLGWALALDGESTQAQVALREAAEDAASHDAPGAETVALASASLLAAAHDDDSRAEVLALGAGEAAERLEPNRSAHVFTSLAAARVALRQGKWERVHRELEHARELLPLVSHTVGVFALFLRIEMTRIHLALGDMAGARQMLEEIDSVLAHEPRLGLFTKEIASLRAELDEDEWRATPARSSLTAAELRLLPLLTTHLSFRAIAERLFVSRNTVKTQAISVYRKLGVSSRNEAITRAAKLGLVGVQGNGSANGNANTGNGPIRP